jgi:hypothetical protein
VARFPSIAARHEQVFVVGNNIPLFDSSRVPSRSLTIWALQKGVERIEPPPGDFSFRFAKPILDSSGQLHLFWGEASDAEPVQAFRWPSIPTTSIWWATYERKTGWSKPERVVSGPRLDWIPSNSSMELLGNRGDIVIALPLGAPLQSRALFRSDHGHWQLTPVPANGIYATLAESRGRLFLAFIAAASGYQQDVNSVFVMRSENGGSTWGQPTLVSRSGVKGAYELQIVPLSDGSLHLVWVQDAGNGSSVIRHVLSRDAGTNWSVPEDLPINAPPGNASLSVASDGCDGLHVLFENWQKGPEDRRLDYAHWQSGWTVAHDLFPNYRASEPAFGRLKNGKVLLVFLAQKAHSKPVSKMWMLHSQGVP